MTTSSGVGTRPEVPHRGITAVVTLVVPLAVLAIALGLAWSWRDELPAQVATHWGSDGVDGVGSPGATMVAFAVMTLVFSLAMWAFGTFAGQTAMARRMAAGFAVWLAVFLGGLLVAMFHVQRGLEDPYAAPGVGVGIAVTLVLSAVLAVGAGLLVPGDPPQPATGALPSSTATLPLDDRARAVWVRTDDVRWPWVLVGGLVVVGVVLSVTTEWWIGLTVAVSVLPVLMLARVTVVVDSRGLDARTFFPWPRVRVPLDEVEDVAVVGVRPFGDFGGWGLRTTIDGGVGLVVRAGDAIEVRATRGRRYVVTVGDAATGAALLATLAGRTR